MSSRRKGVSLGFRIDRISALSDDLLLKILSSLPTEDVVDTMFLSKRWKYLWAMVPKLDFDCDFDSFIDYTISREYVDRFMELHKSPVLETLELDLGRWSNTDDMAKWIRIAIARRVRTLEIRRCCMSQEISLPSCVYTHDKLVVLKLAGEILLDVPTNVRLSSLKSLHLECVEEHGDKEAHRRLLSGCPVLEELVWDKTAGVTLPCLYVLVPSLLRLTIIDENDCENDPAKKVVIDAPSLKYLNIVDACDSGTVYLCENMPEMVEANVNVIYKRPEKLMESLASVKRLSLCLSASVFQPCVEFHQLVRLELYPYVKDCWDLLTWMLESSPKLQVLKLYKCEERGYRGVEPDKGRWGQLSSVPECLLFHLNTFEWNSYNGSREEKKVVAYILRNAQVLKTAEISGRRRRKLKELASLHRASKSCQLLLESD